jgi:selenocysteine lyase/cysteine desulfurase
MTIDTPSILHDTPPYTAGAYFNSAGASLMSRPVISAMVDHLHRESALGAYGAAAAMATELADLYSAAARLVGCDPDEVSLTEGHASGWSQVIGAMKFSPGDRILVGRSEWGGNYAALTHIARRCGATVEVIPSNEFGEVCLTQLAAMLDDRVRLISLTWLPANGGLINPAAAVGALAQAAGVPFVLDAAQAAGQLPVDVRQLGCDVLTAPGRKWLRGPRGTGLMYVRRGFLAQLIPPVVDQFSAPFSGGDYKLREDARRFETSEACIAARLGLRVAIRSALTLGMDAIEQRIIERAQTLRQKLAGIERVQLHDLGRRQSGLVSFNIPGMPASEVRTRLMSLGVEVGVNGVAFTPLDMQARGLTEIVRASPHLYTTDEDIDRLLATVEGLAKRPFQAPA